MIINTGVNIFKVSSKNNDKEPCEGTDLIRNNNGHLSIITRSYDEYCRELRKDSKTILKEDNELFKYPDNFYLGSHNDESPCTFRTLRGAIYNIFSETRRNKFAMILEADEENREFVTVYKKHYYPKRVSRMPKCIHPPNYNLPLNPLNGPFHNYLNAVRQNEKVSLEEKTEDIRDNLKRVRAKYPHLHKLLPEVTPDEKVIELEEIKALKTVYQLEYSRRHDDYLSLHARCTGERKSAVTLSDHWKIPETIHGASYRNPRDFINPNNYAGVRKIAKPANNLGPNEKERNVLRIATGNSEYVDVIGATGRRILKEQLHGVPIPLESRSPRVKGPDSVRSKCSDVLAPRKAPLISHDF